MLIPDLGADLIRIYQISANPDHQNEIEGETTLRLSAGSMPRHAVFVRAQGKTYLYVVEQNANKLASFHVRYLSDGTLGFDELERIDLLPHKTVDPDDDGIKTSELVVSVSLFMCLPPFLLSAPPPLLPPCFPSSQRSEKKQSTHQT